MNALVAMSCPTCAALREERDQLLREISELAKLVELQSADLERLRAEASTANAAASSAAPNQPERVPKNQLQLAFEEVLASIEDKQLRDELEQAVGSDEDATEQGDTADGDVPGNGASDNAGETRTRKPRTKGHGRRALNLTNLPVDEVVIDPEEVVAANGEGFELIDEEVSERVGLRPAEYRRIIVRRRKWKTIRTASKVVTVSEASEFPPEEPDASIVIAPLPDSLWPHFMAEASAIAHGIQSKYGDLLPLNRQQSISARHGFEVPRSTMCGWFKAAYPYCERIVAAMKTESIAGAFCIATDSTGAPVRPPGKGPLERWQVFVFIADQDHIFFDFAPSGTSVAVSAMLEGYKGNVLADAASIFDALYEDGDMSEVGCWSHMRRYFWKALASDAPRAIQALGLISRLFMVDRACALIEMPRRTEVRAARARPILDALDVWVATVEPHADPRSPLSAALTYYRNQREALRRFLVDGRLPIHNNSSESNLRNLVLGRHNWVFFETETGLKYYTVFRSLIASCALHGLNPEQYLQEILRLVPHWPVNRVIELAPKYWRATRERLDARQRAIIMPPWELPSRTVEPRASRARAA